MRQGMYRVLMSIFAAWAALSIPTVLVPTVVALQSGEPLDATDILLAIGFALLPISVAGLWDMHLWGFVSLTLGFFLVVATYPPGILLHAICFGLTVLRYFFAQHEASTGDPCA
jgi:hypothetical protein